MASSVLLPFQGVHTSELPPTDAQLPPGPQLYTNLSKVDCSSTLRPEEYTAADALLRFYQYRDVEAKHEDDRLPNDLKRTELAQGPKVSIHPLSQSIGSTEKKKKKRTHSKTNISDLLNITQDDLQSLVREQLMASSDGDLGIALSGVDVSDFAGRQCKRTRSTREQSSAVDLTRKLMQEKNKENRATGSRYRGSGCESRESSVRCAGNY